jgi:hypothetical protein
MPPRMEARRHERCSEAMLHDFALVTTYLPILGLTLRAALLVSFVYWCMYSAALSFPGVIMLTASIVYLDSMLLRSHTDMASGHLCLCALAVLTQQSARQCSEGGMLAMMIIDLVWSTLVSADMVGSISGVRVHLSPQSKALLACAFASAHVLVGCSSIAYFEMLMRAVLFYVLCAIVILCAPFVPLAHSGSERGACAVLHLCAPVLFVHLYPTIASVLVVVGSHARLIYSSMHRRKQESGKAEPAGDTRGVSPRVGKSSEHSEYKEYSELALKLAAAKRAHGIP